MYFLPLAVSKIYRSTWYLNLTYNFGIENLETFNLWIFATQIVYPFSRFRSCSFEILCMQFEIWKNTQCGVSFLVAYYKVIFNYN